MFDGIREWWEEYDPNDIRERITDVNDGIIAVSGTALGLSGAEVGAGTSFAVLVITAAAGTLSMFGVKLGETLAAREAQMNMVEEERRLLELTPEEEKEELVEWFESKGVTPETSRIVAEELSDADALSAQLEIEYGIKDLTSRANAWFEAYSAGVAFLFGAFLPVLCAFLVPITWRTEWALAVAAVSLTVTSLVMARRGKSNVAFTIGRSLFIGLGTLGATYLVGDAVL